MKQGFFDFLTELAAYAEAPSAVERLNRRHKMIIKPLVPQISGARVLDLAAHDGRWAHAFAAAGASEVVGIEGRSDLVDRYATFPDPETRARVRLTVGDIFDGLEQRAAAGESFDVIGVLGIFYHIMDHFRLLRLVRALGPKMVIIDSEFSLRPAAVITLGRERTDNPLNAIAQVPGQQTAVIGIPSPAALDLMAEVLGFSVEWLDWGTVPKHAREGLADYYRTERKCRMTALLRPL